MSTKTFATIKRAEAQARMASASRARRNRRAALAEDRHGLADGSQGRLTNLPQVLRAMARCA